MRLSCALILTFGTVVFPAFANTYDSEYEAGVATAELGRYQEAETHFLNAVGLAGQDRARSAQAMVWHGRILQRLGRNEEATSELQRALAVLGCLLQDAGNRTDYVAFSQSWLGQAHEYLWELGPSPGERQAHAEASLEAYSAVVFLRPQPRQDLLERGLSGLKRIYLDYGRWLVSAAMSAKAEAVLAKALQYRGDRDREAHYLLGRCHEEQANGEQRLERLRRAEAEYRTALADQPQPGGEARTALRRALIAIGDELLAQGQWTGVESAFREAFALEPDSALGAKWAGAKGRWAQAGVDEVRQLTLLCEAGDLYLKAASLPDGDPKMPIRLRSDATEAYATAASLAASRGDMERVQECAAKLLAVTPGEGRGHYWQAVWLDRKAQPLDRQDPQREQYLKQALQQYSAAREGGLPRPLDGAAEARVEAIQGTVAPPRTTLVVAADGSAPYARLQDALRDAKAGYRVLLRGRGPYKGSFTVGVPDLEIVGEAALGADSPQLETSFGSCLRISGGGLVLRRVRINGKSTTDPAINLVSGRLEAVRCEISAVKMGVAVSTAQTQQCVLRECHVRDAEVGIALFAGAAAELHGCELRGNGVGLSLCQGATATLQDCRVHHNTRSGLSVSAGARAQLTACEVCDNPQSIDGPGDVAADGGRTDPPRAMQ